MKILLIIGLIIFILYNAFFIWLNKEVPESISETSYISKNKFGVTWPFTVICLISAVCIFPLWVTVTPEFYQFVVFLSCAGMMFAGCSPLFKEKFEGTIHYTSGMVAFVAGLAWLILMGQWITLGLIALLGGIRTFFQKEKYTFIFEVISYIAVAITILLF